MQNNQFECPSIEDLEGFCLNDLDDDKTQDVDQHLLKCHVCLGKARSIMDVIQRRELIKADPILGKAWEHVYDTVIEYKCADSRKNKIIELETKKKKYKITLRELEEDKSLCLLEIQVLDKSIKGKIIVNWNGTKLKAQIDRKGLACMVVDSNIDLSGLTICNEDN